MPYDLKIGGSIETTGDAKHRLNLKGSWGEVRRHDFDRFDRITLDTTNLWASYTTGATSATTAISEVQGGSCLFTTGTADNDSQALAKPLIYSGTKLAAVEWRVKITDVSGTAVYVGFSDAKYETNGLIAVAYTDAAVVYTATDCVGFSIDADHTSASSIICVGNKAGTPGTAVDTEVDWADGETKVLRVELDDDDANFYLDGVPIGHIEAAVTAATLLCPILQTMTRANDGANTVYAYRYDAWQDE